MGGAGGGDGSGLTKVAFDTSAAACTRTLIVTMNGCVQWGEVELGGVGLVMW